MHRNSEKILKEILDLRTVFEELKRWRRLSLELARF